MAISALGINKQVALLKQSALGTYTTVTGSQLYRRESSTNSLKIATFGNNELTSHQQSTGKTHGGRMVDIALNGVLSAGTYQAPISSVLRKLFTAPTALTALSLTFGGTLGAYTITGTGLLVSGGFKIGDIVKVTAGTSLPADILNKNLLITAITNTIITFMTLNGSTISTSGTAIVACALALAGKKCWVPDASQTKDYYQVEDWHGDISQSEVFRDVVLGKLDIGLPSSGNATLAVSGAGLDRVTGGTRILTSPTAETTTNPLASITGTLIVNGVAITNVTGLTINIDGKAAAVGSVVGSLVAPDIQRGTIDVSGSFTAFYADTTLVSLFEAATQINLIAIVADNQTATSDFVSFSMSAVTLDSDGKDDGDKAIIRTYAFTARINPNGGPAKSNDHTIISVQDSQAV